MILAIAIMIDKLMPYAINTAAIDFYGFQFSSCCNRQAVELAPKFAWSEAIKSFTGILGA